ncbi:MAG: hypothetical protein ABUS79_23265, partial [Pseudomonadota bacterium]
PQIRFAVGSIDRKRASFASGGSPKPALGIRSATDQRDRIELFPRRNHALPMAKFCRDRLATFLAGV